jgi:hypothetical protein
MRQGEGKNRKEVTDAFARTLGALVPGALEAIVAKIDPEAMVAEDKIAVKFALGLRLKLWLESGRVLRFSSKPISLKGINWEILNSYF